MQGPASHPDGGPRPSLSQRVFPRRVRALLEGILDYLSDELDRGLVTTLNEFEQQLTKLSDQARSNEVQKHCQEALRDVKRGRSELVPRFLLGLEAALATLKEPPRREGGATAASFQHLSLVEDVVMDETITLNEISARSEIRNSLPLFLLGQRLGVIAGRPAFDAESLPFGPNSLCRILRDASGCLNLNSEHRQQFFRQFDRSVMQFIAPLYEALNTYLVRERVLPYLTYVPVRPRRVAQGTVRSESARADAAGSAQSRTAPAPPGGASDGNRGAGGGPGHPGAPGAGQAGGPAVGGNREFGGQGAGPGPNAGSDTRGAGSSAAAQVPRPQTAWPGVPGAAPPAQRQQDTEMFDVLRQLLAGRRSLLGKLDTGQPPRHSAPAHVVSAQDVQSVLGMLQDKPAAPVMVDGKPTPRSVTHLKQDMLAQLRRVAPEGTAPVLPEEQGDTIDLVGMLFDHIMKDVRPNSPASALLTKLQVPLLRVALDDKGFFTRKQHPARQMLNTIAESGAYWTSEDEADRSVVDKMHMLVDRVSKEFNGDLTLFDSLLGDLSGHMQTQARKAEVAERRHVEAARGKEKLELARLRAAEAIDAKLAGKRVPKFLHTLLAQAWADVLALSLLRGGEQSPAFAEQLRIAERLIDSAVARSAGKPSIRADEVPALKAQIEEALSHVGYHANDAQAISGRLLAASASEEEADDPASRTELAMRLKARQRLGDTASPAAGAAAPNEKSVAPLDAAEQVFFDQLRHLPFGTWFEFVTNQQGDIARRRLSWFSTVTGHALFVNHRGQRIADYSLNFLAREMRRGNVRVMQAESESMIDRAWGAIVNALKSFAGRGATVEERGQ